MSSVKNESGQSPSTTTAPNQYPYEVKLTRKEKLMVYLRIGLMLFFEIALPLILFYVLKNYMKEIWALLISGVPPFLVVIYGIISKRRIDILGALIIISFIVSAIVASLKSDARVYLLRESAITGTIGLTFLITLIPIKYGTFQMRPIIFYFAKDMQTGGSFGYSSPKRNNSGLAEEISERWEIYWKKYAIFRRGFIFLTAFWGIGLVVEVPARVIIVLNTPTTERAVFWTNIVTYSWLGVLILVNILYSKWFKKQCRKIIGEGERQTAANQASV
ncbi:hypothetical protein RhiirA5_362062 [Rhizophagus irregularis]|uniref:Uncharacterized protein n=3 Tax=Rhizophagus irregularis TaxID=588596 RepID=U9SMZ3_RHIID|nr:hypothetical protein GLOIN_2v1496390 [Rhizophagus irregularis DAOM 181602=DAOM 197198]EXX50337.1 hypothetical protein RirG_271820 [Rhizophagus irregularis DAOM 197198w]PKC04688.1 hypothetical protein RhiirA5_362062 [Rhizophagus irregularis]PKC72768.1 hypothetical protein RhiirA1_411413 [Rhizophagus irregularis]PKY16826.1 hypothetical protein RhiirB3_403393 [Rhizophagus irregularis]POG82593.1 hypothetical protein GLOIN_2v1496390 [Rhizophagus irregularis DAOM 181602=DAOM 197198]|eukprot:XP_025189459.1 hypothetical protein GLOIN_2v1496390 [Rhizophagus irregularis DAOM 181602=DAOM 197198]